MQNKFKTLFMLYVTTLCSPSQSFANLQEDPTACIESESQTPLDLVDDLSFFQKKAHMEVNSLRGGSSSFREMLDIINKEKTVSSLQAFKEMHPEKYKEGLVRASDNYSAASYVIGHGNSIPLEERTAIAKLLLQDTPLHISDNGGWTPLMHAAYVGNVELVKFAVTLGADTEAQNFQGKNAAYFALTSNQVGWAEKQEILQAVGGRTDFISGYNDTLLHLMTSRIVTRGFDSKERKARLELLQQIAQEHSRVSRLQAVAARDNQGHLLSIDGSPMEYVETYQGKKIKEVEVERTLLDLQNSAGETPLHVAAKNDDVDAAIVFLELGADPNIVSGGKSLGGNGYCPLGSNGKSPLAYFSSNGLERFISSLSPNSLQRFIGRMNQNTRQDLKPQLSYLHREGRLEQIKELFKL